MSRSRSSFDLAGAIATAASLSTADDEPAAGYRRMALVSFGPTAAGPATIAPPPAPEPPSAEPALAADGPAIEDAPNMADAARRPPKLPDLSGVQSPVVRCEMILAWITEAVGAAEVFIADAAGLPLAGAAPDAEARLAGAGVVAAAVAQLAVSIPGNSSTLFELHVGDGPFFQLIGFEAGESRYMVGFTRATPLTYRQAHAVRLACRHALGDPGLGGADSSPGLGGASA
jgi:hypothetical protein